MPIPDRTTYLAEVVTMLKVQWPENRTVNIVCHGHSVPAGYFATPLVDTFHAYPHLLHLRLKARFPYAVINVIVTAIGGENSTSGAARFADVLAHRPDVVTIDYGLNDRRIGLEQVRQNWGAMIQAALAAGSRVMLLTPTPDITQRQDADPAARQELRDHAAQIRELAAEYGVGLADSFAACQRYLADGGDLSDLLSWSNHPNAAGHALVARELLRWFPMA